MGVLRIGHLGEMGGAGWISLSGMMSMFEKARLKRELSELREENRQLNKVNFSLSTTSETNASRISKIVDLVNNASSKLGIFWIHVHQTEGGKYFVCTGIRRETQFEYHAHDIDEIKIGARVQPVHAEFYATIERYSYSDSLDKDNTVIRLVLIANYPGYEDLGICSCFMGDFLKRISEFKPVRIHGELQGALGDHRSRQIHFYEKFGFRVFKDQADKSMVELNLP